MLVIADNIHQWASSPASSRQRHIFGKRRNRHSFNMCLPQDYDTNRRKRFHETTSLDAENQIFVLDTIRRLTLGLRKENRR